MRLIKYQEDSEDNVKKAIIALENMAWPCNQEDGIFPSAPNTYVTSFVLMEK